MEDINLDFLSSPPSLQQHTERLPTPNVMNRFSNVLQTKHRRLEIAEKIAKVDELVREIERFKLDNNELKRQLKDFQKTAADVQNMYSEEKQNHESVKVDLVQLKQKYDKIDIDLANKTMVYDQMCARLAEYEGRPIDYNSLLVKFVKIMLKLDGEDCLKYLQEKTLVEELQQYCVEMKLKIPITKSPKKRKCRTLKPKTVNSSVQCSDLGINGLLNKPVMREQHTQCVDTKMKENLCLSRPELKDQYTQCQVARRDQASQYISTMITRQTNTEKIAQKHVSTMFPEPKPTPPINDILNVFCKWADIKSITPLDHSPKSKQSNKVSKATNTTIGTCTMLCNIRRKIDYLPPFSPGIKQELTTPSPSPTPTSNSASGPSNRTPTSSLHTNMNNQNHLPNSILTLFNGNSNSALGQLSTPAFNELWQIFGTMLLSLLQTSNAGIANISQNSINQQQFLDWLLELYVNSQLSSTTSTQTVAHQVNSTQTNPLRFVESSVLSSANIVRPQVKKIGTGLCTRTENDIASQSESSGGNNSQYMEQQTSVINTTPNLTDDIYSQDSNSTDIEVQNIQAAANIIEEQTETNFNQFIKTRKIPKKSQKNIRNQKLLEKIQEFLPETKVNKKNRKALKRLLNKPKKKLLKNERVEISMYHHDTDNEHIETAVDFLKFFALDQGEFTNVSHINGTTGHTEIENCATRKPTNVHTENLQHCRTSGASTRIDDFKFIKPAVSQTQSHTYKVNFNNGTFIKPAEKPKQPNITKSIENKYQILFGDSDNEIDEEEKIFNQHTNTVISAEDFKNINENPAAQTFENCKSSLGIIKDNCYQTDSPARSLQILTDSSYAISDKKYSLTNSLDQTTTVTSFQQTKTNILDISSQEQFSIQEISTPLLKDFKSMYPLNKQFNPVFNKLEEDTAIEKPSEMQPCLTESDTMADIPCQIVKDIELSSDEETTTTKNYHQMKNELLPSNNDIYTLETDLKNYPKTLENEDKKWKYKTNSHEEKTQNYNNIEFSYNTNSPIPAIIKTCTQQDMSEFYCRENLENNQTKTRGNSNNLESFSITKSYTNDFEKDFELSSDNESVLSENVDQSKDELKPTYKIKRISSADSSSESEENRRPTNSPNIEQEFYGFDNCHVSDHNLEQELKGEEQYLQERRATSSNNSQNDDLATTDNSSLSSTCDDEEISIIEISTDVTGLENEREQEHDLIIDEDYYDKTSEKSELNLNPSRNNSPACDDKTTVPNYPLICEDHNYSKSRLNDSINNYEALDSSTISNLINSSLYNELLTDSIRPIVSDLLTDDVIIKTPLQIIKSQRGRKRKSECLAEVVQPCKRSQRLKAKQMVLEQSLNVSEISIEIGKYTRSRRNSNKDFKPVNLEETKIKNLNQITTNTDPEFGTDLKNNMSMIQMGFFLERRGEEAPKKEFTLNTNKKYSSCKNALERHMKSTEENNVNGKITSSANSIENSCETKDSDHGNYDNIATLNEAFCTYSESPKSPAPVDSNHDLLNATCTINIPLERPLHYLPDQRDATLFDSLINSYSKDNHKYIHPNVQTKVYNRQQQILHQLQMDIEIYCNSEMKLDPDHMAYHLINKLLKKIEDYDLIQKAVLNVAQMAESLTVPEKELPSIIQELPPRHLGCTLQRLFVLLKHFLNRNRNFCRELMFKIENLFFTSQVVEKMSLQATLNLTQLYLSACKQQESVLSLSKHPGRLFIAKCLYYYNKKAVLMVHEVLLWYPTVLPYREDKTYDRSDALITVIQEILMNTRYEMENEQLRGKSLISKLRYEYHYEAYSPSLDEVIVNLVDKLKNSKFYNISMAFGLLCKRLEPAKVQEKFIKAHLLPLANEYYNKAQLTMEYDKRISVLLEIISMIVKPFPVDTNIDVYLNEFSKFLNRFERAVIQEAALCSIIRLQRFGYVNCFNLLHHFKPTFDLGAHTQAMLKTFLHRKPLTFWKTIKSQNPRYNY